MRKREFDLDTSLGDDMLQADSTARHSLFPPQASYKSLLLQDAA